MITPRMPLIAAVTPDKSRHALAVSLSNTRTATLLIFYSQVCPLCKALRSDVARMPKTVAWLSTVELCADDFQSWAPEMLRYSVESVPCLVLLDKTGVAQ
jgi:thioredoxin-related protein